MDLEQLKEFLLDANRHGYGNETTKIKREDDNSETIVYEKGSWKFHDNWVGGKKFGGRDIVSYNQNPVWIMAYYGFPLSNEVDVEALYGFLKKALTEMPADLPLRGPESMTEGEWQYKIKVDGDIERFTAFEEIYFRSNMVYEARLIGGLVGD